MAGGDTNIAALLDDSTEPLIVGLVAPTFNPARVKRNPPTVHIILSWGAVLGATRYRVQLAKTLVFDRLLVDEELIRTRFTAKRLKPSVYFVRVRASIHARSVRA